MNKRRFHRQDRSVPIHHSPFRTDAGRTLIERYIIIRLIQTVLNDVYLEQPIICQRYLLMLFTVARINLMLFNPFSRLVICCSSTMLRSASLRWPIWDGNKSLFLPKLHKLPPTTLADATENYSADSCWTEITKQNWLPLIRWRGTSNLYFKKFIKFHE